MAYILKFQHAMRRAKLGVWRLCDGTRKLEWEPHTGQAAGCDQKKRHTLGEGARALQILSRSNAVRSRRRVEVVGMKR